MSNHEKLLPCSVCGGEARLSSDGYSLDLRVRCDECGARTEDFETDKEAIAAWNRRSPPAAVPDEWNKLLLAAKLLYQNAEGCAVNHHEVDFKAFGLPGWLADCKRDIENAEASLAMTTAAAPVQEPVAWADFADNGNIRLWTKTSEQLRAQLETDAGRKMQPLYAAPVPTGKQVEGLKAAIRAAKLALFLIRKRGVIPNASWESGFNRDLEIAENALSASPATTTASDGWVMVPREPTPDMANAGDEYMPLFREWPEYAGLTGADVAVDVYRAMISAAPAAPNGWQPIVKPLEWKDLSYDDSVLHKASWGEYSIIKDDSYEWPYMLRPFIAGPSNFRTLEDAKAAVQADYERRILSALSLPAAPTEGSDE